MRKIVAAIMLCGAVLAANAVPARRGWQTRTQADGSTIEVQLLGDEYYHYLVNRDGQQVREVNGMYEVVGEAPTAAQVHARRAKSARVNIRKAKKEFGVSPNLAPRGIVIMVNFKDQSFRSSNTRQVIDSLCNAKNCKVNKDGNVLYPSAGQYFRDQSNGVYSPVFDVYGPVMLSHEVAYYGGNDVAGNDIRPANMLVEACKKADTQYNVDFTKYDSDKDGRIDFVYIIYAGQGEASGGSKETIWPHSYSLLETIEIDEYYTTTEGAREWKREYGEAYIPYFSNEYSLSDCYVDGKLINTYACSNELSGSSLAGIGTLCHEFGHVMGLPDFYETNYGNNSKNAVTPNDWEVMDGGAYNGDGHCPPNYSAWEKYFFGWHTPINLGNEGQNLTLYANGTENYQAYQINAFGKLQTATTEGLNYYIENRQATGWDSELPHHGLLIWKVNYNAEAWKNNAPNNDETTGSPLYTIVSASGTKIGTHSNSSGTASVYDGPKNPFPGSANVTSKTLEGKPLKNIKESNGVITLTYIEEPVIPVDPFDVVFMANGEGFGTISSTGKLILPTSQPEACTDGKVFVGWTATADYKSETTAPAFAAAGDAVEEGAVFYAVFATKDGEGATEQKTTTYTFTAKDWSDATNSWKSNGDGLSYHSDKQGVQITQGTTGAGAQTKSEMTNVSKIVVKYCTNARNGAGSVQMSVGTESASKEFTKAGGATLRTLEYSFNKASGKVGIKVNCTTNSIYINSIAITSGSGVSYKDYTTVCGGDETDVENTATPVTAVKTLRNGQLVIIRGNAVYSASGVRIQ